MGEIHFIRAEMWNVAKKICNVGPTRIVCRAFELVSNRRIPPYNNLMCITVNRHELGASRECVCVCAQHHRIVPRYMRIPYTNVTIVKRFRAGVHLQMRSIFQTIMN